MNHYINLLEDAERHFHSAASTNRKLQAGILAAAALVIFGIVSAVFKHTHYMKTTTDQIAEWERLKPEYQAALTRRDIVEWAVQNEQTLQGWTTSRHDWTALLQLIRDEIPSPAHTVQLKSLSISETVDGLTNARIRTKNKYPAERLAKVFVQGLAEGLDGRRTALRYHANLIGRSGPGKLIQDVSLDPTEIENGHTAFRMTITLNSKVLKP